jgi:hypothetical protein
VLEDHFQQGNKTSHHHIHVEKAMYFVMGKNNLQYIDLRIEASM